MKFKATKEQVIKIITNAINASKPMGMGSLFWRNKDYKTEEIEILLGNSTEVDYFQGRMVKLFIGSCQTSPSIKEPNIYETFRNPKIDYQSWVTKYPTYEDLVTSVEGVEIILD